MINLELNIEGFNRQPKTFFSVPYGSQLAVRAMATMFRQIDRNSAAMPLATTACAHISRARKNPIKSIA